MRVGTGVALGLYLSSLIVAYLLLKAGDRVGEWLQVLPL